MKVDLNSNGEMLFWSSRRRKWVLGDHFNIPGNARIDLRPRDKFIPYSVFQAYHVSKRPLPGYAYGSFIYLTVEGEGVNEHELVKNSNWRFIDTDKTDFCSLCPLIKERFVDRNCIIHFLLPSARILEKKHGEKILHAIVKPNGHNIYSEAVFKDLSILDFLIKESKKAHFWGKYKHIRDTIGKFKSTKKRRNILGFAKQQDKMIIGNHNHIRDRFKNHIKELSELFPGRTIRINLDSSEWLVPPYEENI